MEESVSQPSKLDISTRSYTPLKARPYERKIVGNYSTVHNYLFYLSKDKKAEAARDAEREKQYTDNNAKVLSKEDENKVVHRLYERSKSLQHDGRERREKIETRLAPKVKSPSKKISQDKAAAFFDRQMAHKAAVEQRIANAQVNRPPRSRVRDGVLDSHDMNRERAMTPARGRSITPARGRSMTPARGRSITPSRGRSLTPDGVRGQSVTRTLSSMRSRSPSPGRAQSRNRSQAQDSRESREQTSHLRPMTRSASPGRNFRALQD